MTCHYESVAEFPNPDIIYSYLVLRPRLINPNRPHSLSLTTMSILRSIQSSISSTFTFAYDACCRAVEQTVVNALKQGPIPRHVSFVMDGNRRFAQKINVKTGEGHYAGFKQGEKVKVTFTFLVVVVYRE